MAIILKHMEYFVTSEKPGEGKPLEYKSPIGTPEEGVLSHYEKEHSMSLNGGINKALFVSLLGDGSGVFKSRAGECQGLRYYIETGTFMYRERAAYLVDRFLSFNLVPPTVIREIDGQIGSFQQFIPDAVLGIKVAKDKLMEDPYQQQLMRMWVFDYIIHNSDRHNENFLLHEPLDESDLVGKKIHAIDNGLSFSPDKLRLYGDFFDQQLPKDILINLESFLANEINQQLCADLLAELISAKEVANCMWRIKNVTGLIKKHNGMLPWQVKDDLTFDETDNKYDGHISYKDYEG